MDMSRIAAVAALVVLVVPVTTGCDRNLRTGTTSNRHTTGKLDVSGSEACTAGSDWRRATDTAARLQLADRVERSARRSDTTAVSERAAALGSSADAGKRAWDRAAAALLRSCRQAGWKPHRH